MLSVLYLCFVTNALFQYPSDNGIFGIARSHHCINDDFIAEHKVGVWTMLSDNMQYTLGAAKMGKGVKRHTKTPHDLIIMEIESKPLSQEHWDVLSPIGFKKCVVKSIPPPKPDKTRFDLQEKFGVLHVWAMTVYDTVLFIDADTFVQNSLDSLINMDLEGKAIGVTKDIRAKKWVDTFNSGVMLLHPSVKEYERLLTLLYSGIKFEYMMSDQGFLNEVYRDNWHEIGFLNNANLALYKHQREFWDKHMLEDINIIHYTMKKPWKCKSNGSYGPICSLWINFE
jgi:alpha-N-acetylglucosamine transferase